MAKKAETKTEKIEREYVIPLKIKWQRVPRYKRANKAIKAIREFLVRHMKIRDRDLNKIRIDKQLNEAVWFRGIKKPPIRIKVRAIKENDLVRAELVDIPEKLKFKKLRELKREQKAIEAVEKKKTLLQKAKESGKPSEEKSEEQIKAEEEKKKEEKEKTKAVAEAEKSISKAAAKSAKHSAGGKTKQPKHQQRKALAK